MATLTKDQVVAQLYELPEIETLIGEAGGLHRELSRTGCRGLPDPSLLAVR